VFAGRKRLDLFRSFRSPAFSPAGRGISRVPSQSKPLHPSNTRQNSGAVCFLWHFPSNGLPPILPDVIRHTALWSSDFPPPSLTNESGHPVQLPTQSLYSMGDLDPRSTGFECCSGQRKKYCHPERSSWFAQRSSCTVEVEAFSGPIRQIRFAHFLRAG
jgi:hypothetical protein